MDSLREQSEILMAVIPEAISELVQFAMKQMEKSNLSSN